MTFFYFFSENSIIIILSNNYYQAIFIIIIEFKKYIKIFIIHTYMMYVVRTSKICRVIVYIDLFSLDARKAWQYRLLQFQKLHRAKGYVKPNDMYSDGDTHVMLYLRWRETCNTSHNLTDVYKLSASDASEMAICISSDINEKQHDRHNISFIFIITQLLHKVEMYN